MNTNFTQFHISLRDYFAAQAMNTLLHIHPITGARGDLNPIAHYSYIVADCMLQAREGKLNDE